MLSSGPSWPLIAAAAGPVWAQDVPGAGPVRVGADEARGALVVDCGRRTDPIGVAWVVSVAAAGWMAGPEWAGVGLRVAVVPLVVDVPAEALRVPRPEWRRLVTIRFG